MDVGAKVRRHEIGPSRSAGGRPILLATIGAPFDEEATAFAVDSAVEAGQPLIVANITALEPLGLSVMLGYDALEEFTPEVSESVRRPVELAQSLGVTVERLRIRSPRPIQALLQLAWERRPGLLVFGADRRGLSPRRYRRAVHAIREGAGCLIWVVPEPAA
jgi:nucleotide-binding universal stress UspA family protein